jgi:hypothetical protein
MRSINSQRSPSGSGTFALGIIGLAVFAAVVVGWIKWTAKADDVNDERAAARIKKRQELQAAWAAKLHTAAWVDKEKGIVQVPIDDAIRVMATELKAKSVTKSEVKVPPPLLAAPVDPKSTEPPPLALPSAPQGADMIQFSGAALEAPPAAPPTATPPAPTGTTPAPTPPGATPPPATPPPAASTPVPPAATSGNATPAVDPTSVGGVPARPPLINRTESK